MTATISDPMRLRTLLESVKYATSSVATRCNLNAIQLERDGDDLLAIATDGHRLACHRVADFPLPLTDKGLMVGPHTLKDIQKTLHKKGGGAISADFGHFNNGFLMVVKGRESCEITPHDSDGVEYGDFPNWHNVIPKAPREDEFCKIEKPQVLADDFEALAAIRTMVVAKLAGGKLKLSVKFELSGGTRKGTATHAAIGGEPAEIGVNGFYMAEALRSLRGEVSARIVANNQSMEPILMRDASDDIAVVMPMRR